MPDLVILIVMQMFQVDKTFKYHIFKLMQLFKIRNFKIIWTTNFQSLKVLEFENSNFWSDSDSVKYENFKVMFVHALWHPPYLKMSHSLPLYLYFFCLFNRADSKQMFNLNFAGDWIRTSDLWYQKRLYCQPSHNHPTTLT